jgi:hypothetical protein
MSNATGALSLLLEWVAGNKQLRHFAIEDDPADGIRLRLSETIRGDIGEPAKTAEMRGIVSRRQDMTVLEAVLASEIASMIELIRRGVRDEKCATRFAPGTAWVVESPFAHDALLMKVVKLDNETITIRHCGSMEYLGDLPMHIDEWLKRKPSGPCR